MEKQRTCWTNTEHKEINQEEEIVYDIKNLFKNDFNEFY